MSFVEEWESNGIFEMNIHKILVRHLLFEWSLHGNHQSSSKLRSVLSKIEEEIS